MSSLWKARPEYTVTIDGVEYKTRSWMMDSKEGDGQSRHDAYYGQFATEAVKGVVFKHFGSNQWQKMIGAYQADPKAFHLNFEYTGIALEKWDSLGGYLKELVGPLKTKIDYEERPAGRYSWSISDGVCVAKAAARVLIKEMV